MVSVWLLSRQVIFSRYLKLYEAQFEPLAPAQRMELRILTNVFSATVCNPAYIELYDRVMPASDADIEYEAACLSRLYKEREAFYSGLLWLREIDGAALGIGGALLLLIGSL